MSGRQFCLKNPQLFSNLRMEHLFLVCGGTIGDSRFEEDICSCEKATGKPVVFGWAFRTGGLVFPFAWDTANSFSNKVQESFPFMIRVQREAGIPFTITS